MDRVADLQSHSLLQRAQLVKAAPLANQRISQIRLNSAILHRQAQLQVKAIGRKIEPAQLTQSVTEPPRIDDDGRHNTGIKLVAAAPTGRVEALEIQVRLERMVRQLDAGIVISQLLTNRLQLRPLLHGFRQSLDGVDG